MVRLSPVAGVCVVLVAAGMANAQDGSRLLDQSDAPVVAVYGLAKNDELNVRASASPVAMVIARLPNGAMVKNFGCATVGANLWCKVSTPENTATKGWAPGRYITGAVASADAMEPPPADVAAEQTALNEKSVLDADEIAPLDDPKKAKDPNASLPVAAYVNVPATANRDGVAESDKTGAVSAATALATGVEPTQGRMGDQLEAAVQDASSLPREQPAAQQDEQPAAQQDEQAGVTSESDPIAPENAPLPAARPEEKAVVVAAAETEKPAAREPLQSRVVSEPASTGSVIVAANALSEEDGEVACARYRGQPMTRCNAHAVRTAPGQASVKVNWPDGGSRVINFQDGKPVSSDSSAALQVTRDVDLNMIRIGKAERFEITDSFAFGD